jgi:hypothetical protein
MRLDRCKTYTFNENEIQYSKLQYKYRYLVQFYQFLNFSKGTFLLKYEKSIFRYRYLVLALLTVLVGGCTCLLPYSHNLLTMYVVSFFFGFGGGALDTGRENILHRLKFCPLTGTFKSLKIFRFLCAIITVKTKTEI